MTRHIKSVIVYILLLFSVGITHAQPTSDLLAMVTDELTDAGTTIRPFFADLAYSDGNAIKDYNRLHTGGNSPFNNHPICDETSGKVPKYAVEATSDGSSKHEDSSNQNDHTDSEPLKIEKTGCELLNMLADDFANSSKTLRPFFEDAANAGGKAFKAWKKLISKQAWRNNVNYLTKVTRYTDNGLQLVDEGGEIVVKQANGVKVGKLDPNDFYEPGQMRVFGETCGRHFDPDLAGGLIVKKSWVNPNITQQGIDDVVTHLIRFGPDLDNANMIARLNQIKNGEIPITDIDKRFYTHELEELARYRNHGIPDGVNSGVYNGIDAKDFYYNAHAASLEAYSVNPAILPLYH